VCELVPLFDISQPTLSHHLKKLREAGIVLVAVFLIWSGRGGSAVTSASDDLLVTPIRGMITATIPPATLAPTQMPSATPTHTITPAPVNTSTPFPTLTASSTLELKPTSTLRPPSG